MPPCPAPRAGTARLNPHRLSSGPAQLRAACTGVSHLAYFLLPLPCCPTSRNKTLQTQTHSQQARAVDLAHRPPDGCPDRAARVAFCAKGHLQCHLGQAAHF